MRIDEIVNQVFTRSFMGYDIEQVDVFLDEVIETLERYEAEKQEMLAAMEYLMKKLERGQKMPFADMKKAIDNERQLPK
jgi:DivIVA domain-containing protein